MSKRLYKSRNNSVIGGVCGGIGEYFGIDPTMVRLGLVLFGFMAGSGILAYIIAVFIIPEPPSETDRYYEHHAPHDHHVGHGHQDHGHQQDQNRHN